MTARKSVLVPLGIGCLFAALTFEISAFTFHSSHSSFSAALHFILVSLMPGIFCSMAASGNVHAFHLWVAALANFVLYFALSWSVIGLGRMILGQKK
jgi:uncharacterized membrane protein